MTQAQPERDDPLAGLVRALRAWGLGGMAAVLLEHSGPLALLGAQALYFAAPVAQPFGTGPLAHWAEALEDPAAVERLAQRLRAPAALPPTQP